MTTKTTGAKFKRFYSDESIWPPDGSVWHEDEAVVVDGVEIDGYEHAYDSIADAAEVKISDGIVYGPEWKGNEPSFETYFKRWRKKQTTTTFVVDAPNDRIEAVKAAIVAAGGKIVK